MTKLDQRIKAEKAIVKALVKQILDRGYWVKVCIEDDIQIFDKPTKAVNHILSVDECYVLCHDWRTERNCATFYFVFGNNGFDCIADMTDNQLAHNIDFALDPLVKSWENKLI
jgi:hypothetical protein